MSNSGSNYCVTVHTKAHTNAHSARNRASGDIEEEEENNDGNANNNYSNDDDDDDDLFHDEIDDDEIDDASAGNNGTDTGSISGSIPSSNGAAEFGIAARIDRGAVRELVRDDIRELKKGLVVLLLLFVAIAGLIALDDAYNYDGDPYSNNDDNSNSNHHRQKRNGTPPHPHPHRGHQLRINASAFTANDFECLQLDTKNWPSERVHCELVAAAAAELASIGTDAIDSDSNIDSNNNNDDVARYEFVVEHFDDDRCRHPNARNPTTRHTASGCFYFETYNHSYNDLCHTNRTFTVSAFYGPGCATPMPVTAVNLPVEQEQKNDDDDDDDHGGW